MDSVTTAACCEQIRQCVQERIGENRFRTWFEDASFSLEDEVLVVQIANHFAGKWIAANFLDDLYATARELLGQGERVDVRIVVAGPETQAGERPSATAGGPVRRPRSQSRRPPAFSSSALDDFVVGPCNAMAFSAASTLARTGGRAFRLVVIHGGVGLGKTHLIQGVCGAIRRGDATVECRYITGEEFTNEFISAVRSGRIEQFRSRFRSVDVLAIDDIHFLAHKKATQEEFLHTYNALDVGGGSVVLTSDCHPRTIATLSEPLIDRLISGMVVSIDAPDLATRREILARMARKRNQTLPDEVLDFVATHVTRNIRELEGAFHTLIAYAALIHARITLDVARTALRDRFVQTSPGVQPRDIEKIVVQHLGVSTEQLRSRSRDRTVSLARALAAFLMRRHTDLSYPEIGRALGKKNHSTVLMAAQRMEKLLHRDGGVSWKNGAELHRCSLRSVLETLERQLGPAVA